MNWDKELALAERAARKAGVYLIDGFSKSQTVLSEQGRDIKLKADRDAEAVIIESLSESGYGVLAEESGEQGVLEGDAVYWVVDPLDGTANYDRGLPLCCTSIALCKGAEPVVGVIYDFLRNECFVGAEGVAATLNGKRISVSTVVRTEKAVLATGLPVNSDFSHENLAKFAERLRRYKKVRMLGTAALMNAYVACGRVDAYHEEGIMFWDVAAGLALVRAAGGHVGIEFLKDAKWGCNIWSASSPELVL